MATVTVFLLQRTGCPLAERLRSTKVSERAKFPLKLKGKKLTKATIQYLAHITKVKLS